MIPALGALRPRTVLAEAVGAVTCQHLICVQGIVRAERGRRVYLGRYITVRSPPGYQLIKCSSSNSGSNVGSGSSGGSGSNSSNGGGVSISTSGSTLSAPPGPRLQLMLSVALVMAAGVSNRVLYKMALVPMQDFVFFLAQLQNLTYLAVYFTVLGLRMRSGKVTAAMVQLDKRPLWAVGACEAVAQLLFMIGASHLPGALLPVISQSYLIWNLLLASLLLGTRFSRHQVMGVMLILLGVVLAAVPPPTLLSLLPLGLQQALSAGPPAAEAAAGAAGAGIMVAARATGVAGGQLGHALVCLLCFAFFALAAIIKAVFVLLLLPVTTAMYGLSLADLPTYLAGGWHCLCGHPPAAALAQQLAAASGQGAGGAAAAAVTQAGVSAAGRGGTGAPLLPALYVAVNLGFNVASLRLLRSVGTVTSTIVGSCMVPLTIAAFCLPLPFLPQTQMTASFIFGVAVLLLGLAVYNVEALTSKAASPAMDAVAPLPALDSPSPDH